MASGVSSMMRSAPVRVSSVRMLRPSPADDAALHLVVGQGHHADGSLRHVVGGAALDGDGDDLAGELIGVVLEVRLDLLDLERGVMLASF